MLVPLTAALIFLSQPSLPDIRTVPTEAGTIKVETVAKGLDRPWGLAFLPDGEMLVTEKPGTLRRMPGPLDLVRDVVTGRRPRSRRYRHCT